jgi:hypothetical protein
MDGADEGADCAAAKPAATKLATTIRPARRIGEIKRGKDIEATSNTEFCATSGKKTACYWN